MKKIIGNNRQYDTRSLLNDHKNKPQNMEVTTKIGILQSKLTQPAPKTQKPLLIKNRNKSVETQQMSPRNKLSSTVQLIKEPFSKSEEQTKAEQDSRSEESTKPCASWEGVLGEYRYQIMTYLYRREDEFKIERSYLHLNHILSPKFRSYLVKHIFKICERWELLRTTLHLAVFYLDQYFSRNPFIKDQIEGVHSAQACLFIAMKYEEIYPPELKEWVDRRQKEDVVKMEAKVLTTLNFQLAHHTLQHHLKLLSWEKGESPDEDYSLTHLLADLSLFDLNIRQIETNKLADAIRALSCGQNPSDYKIGLSVKWMIERNSDSLYWLKQHKYGHVADILLF